MLNAAADCPTHKNLESGQIKFLSNSLSGLLCSSRCSRTFLSIIYVHETPCQLLAAATAKGSLATATWQGLARAVVSVAQRFDKASLSA